MKHLSFFIITLIFVSLFTACEADDPIPENSEELITTLRIVCTPNAGGPTAMMEFLDLDGDGGNAPVIMADTLLAQTEYNAVLMLLNESVFPAENITEEILEEDEDHQFFFDFVGIQLAHVYIDMDGNGNPVGLMNKFITADAGTGSLKVTLRHHPDKSATGVTDGDITNAGGETDIEVIFPVVVK